MIEVKGVEKSYGPLKVLKGIDLHINNSEVVSIVGASGAGKSTLLHLIGSLDKPDAGEITISGIQLNNLKGKKLASFRNQKLGFIFQFHHLLPEFNALENVCIPAFIAGFSKKKSEQKATELLDFLGLRERLLHKPSELSGGEQQRVAVARALVNSPSVILADEPSGNLDSSSANDLHHLFFKLREEFKQTFVIVTHNEELADMADRKIVMRDGNLVS